MAYSIANPTSLADVHPTQPTLKVPKQIGWSPDVFEWTVGKQPAYSAPVSDTDIEAILARVAALETGISITAVNTPTFYSGASIDASVTAGKASYPTPVLNNEFYAVYTDSNGIPVITQLWKYMGINLNKRWIKLVDTNTATVDGINDRLNANETSILNLQSAVGNQVELNVTVYYEDIYMADSPSTPVSIANLSPAANINQAKRILFKDFQCDYVSNGTTWVKTASRPFDNSGELAPMFPHPTAHIQGFQVEDVLYYGVLREGGNINVSMLDTINGKANWILSGQQFGLFHHAAIMHMAEEGSEWHLFKYTGYDIGEGVIGGSFTFTDSSATLVQLQASPLNNAVFTEKV